MENRAFEDDLYAGKSAKKIASNVETVSSRRQKIALVKNVVIISFAFMLLFTSFQSMASLQSSINKDANLGTYSLSVIYASLIISSMFVPSYALKKLGEKWGMVAAMLCYSLYIAAQFYPRMYTLVPAAIILGFGAAPLWIAKCAYLTKAGNKYGEMSDSEAEPYIVRFFGIFFLFFQSSSVWGNLISSWALAIGREADNSTLSDEALSICGVNYCPGTVQVTESENSSETQENFKTTDTQIYTLAGIYLACALLSPVVIAILVDPITRFIEYTATENEPTGFTLVAATIRQMGKHYQLLLIPITIWSGLEQGFFGADFTAAFITCGWGVHNVGYVMITYGVCDAIFSMAFGGIIKVVGRVPIFMFGAILNIIVIGILFNWMPNPNDTYVFFIMAGLWGVADAVWQTQINAFYGVIFSAEDSSAGFSNYRLWESVGFIFAYILQTQVCVLAKLWVLIVTLVIGMMGYLAIELLERRRKA